MVVIARVHNHACWLKAGGSKLVAAVFSFKSQGGRCIGVNYDVDNVEMLEFHVAETVDTG